VLSVTGQLNMIPQPISVLIAHPTFWRSGIEVI